MDKLYEFDDRRHYQHYMRTFTLKSQFNQLLERKLSLSVRHFYLCLESIQSFVYQTSGFAVFISISLQKKSIKNSGCDVKFCQIFEVMKRISALLPS